MIPNIKDFNDKLAKGLISVEKIDEENYAIGSKQFSAEDGTELPMTVTGATVTEVDEAIKAKQAELDELAAFKKGLLAVE